MVGRDWEIGKQVYLTWTSDVEGDTFCPGAIASQGGGSDSSRVVPGGQQSQVDPTNFGISKTGHTKHCGLLWAAQTASWEWGGRAGPDQDRGVWVPTSPRRRYLISYLRMSPLGSAGSSQCKMTLFLPAAFQATFPGMPSASPAGGSIEQMGHKRFLLFTFKPSLSWVKLGGLEKFHNDGNGEG